MVTRKEKPERMKGFIQGSGQFVAYQRTHTQKKESGALIIQSLWHMLTCHGYGGSTS